jgi:hypothetical protein
MSTSDRLHSSLEAIVGAILPRLRAELAFYCPWEMTVLLATPPAPPAPPIEPPVPPAPSGVFVTGATVTCAPIDATVAALLPPMVTVPLRPGPSGLVCMPATGSRVLVAFANADPGRPFILALDAQVMPALCLAQQLKIFCYPSGAPLNVGSLPAAAAALLVALETLG